MTMDLLCQEMRLACWDSSESLVSPKSAVTANKWTGCDSKGDVVRESQRKAEVEEDVSAVSQSGLASFLSSEEIDRMEGFPSFRLCVPL